MDLGVVGVAGGILDFLGVVGVAGGILDFLGDVGVAGGMLDFLGVVGVVGGMLNLLPRRESPPLFGVPGSGASPFIIGVVGTLKATFYVKSNICIIVSTVDFYQ